MSPLTSFHVLGLASRESHSGLKKILCSAKGDDLRGSLARTIADDEMVQYVTGIEGDLQRPRLVLGWI